MPRGARQLPRSRPAVVTSFFVLAAAAQTAQASDFEGLQIGEIRIEGAHRVSAARVRTMVRSGEGGLLDSTLLSDDLRRVFTMGRFSDVSVDARFGPNGVIVTFTVVERPVDPELEVRRMRVVGVAAERRAGVEALIESVGEPWAPRRLDEDRRRVSEYYADEGFAAATVYRPTMQVLPDRSGVVGVLRVQEGPVYRVGRVEGLEDHGLTPGDPLRRRDLVTAVRARLGDLREAGHARARMVPRLILDPHRAVGDVVFVQDAGRLMKLGRVDFAGNSLTIDRVLRRDLTVEEGDPWSDSGLRETRRRLLATGLFESVRVTEIDDGVGDSIDVEIAVVEHETLLWKAGGGAASEEVWLTGALAHNNVFGRAWNAEVSGRVSEIRAEGELAFRDPRVLDSLWSVAVRGGARRLDFLDARRVWDGGSLTVGRWWTPDLSVGVTYEVAREGLTTRGSSILADPASTSAIGLTGVYKRRHRLTVRAAPDALGTSLPFWELDASANQPVGSLFGVELSLLGRYQRVGGLGAARAPAHRLYYWGGPGAIRGYPRWSVGPADRAIVGSAELSWPLPGEERVGLGLFGDLGRVGEQTLSSAGGGVWARVGPGRVRVECGVPIDRRTGDEAFACDLRLSR